MKGLFGTIIVLTTIQLVICTRTLQELNTEGEETPEPPTTPNTKDACTKFKCEKEHPNVRIGYFSGFAIEDRFLNDSKQTSVTEKTEKECVKGCVKQKQCRTISVVKEDVKNFTCYLSNSNIYEGEVIVKKNSKIISLGPPDCLKLPCKNGGTCKPNYNQGGYTCACPTKWTGTHCTDSQGIHLLPKFTFTFDNDLNPTLSDDKLKTKYGITVKEGTQVGYVPDATTPVLMIKAGEGTGAIYRFQSINFFADPIVSPRNLTIGFWFKAELEKEKTDKVNLFNMNGYYDFTVAYNLLEFNFNTDQGYKMTKCNDVALRKTWNHVVLRIDKKYVKLSLNGKVCKWRKADGFSNIGRYGNQFEFLSSPAYCTRFIDSFKVYNDYLKTEICEEWYEYEKKNYLFN